MGTIRKKMNFVQRFTWLSNQNESIQKSQFDLQIDSILRIQRCTNFMNFCYTKWKSSLTIGF